MKSIFTLLLLLFVFSSNGQTESEPNNIFEQATPIAANSAISGSVETNNDVYDYFVTTLPQDGTMKIYVQATNKGSGTGYIYMYGYDRRKASGTVFGTYLGSSATIVGTTINDTVTVYGRAADTFYFRLQTNRQFDYTFSYQMVETSVNDAEPNNTFENALLINPLEEKEGHIGYLSNGSDDAYDYYKTVLPQDGTMKIQVRGTNRRGSNGYLYMYGYDRRKASGTVFGEYIGSSSVANGETTTDTIYVYGRAADTFYFRIQSNGAFSYRFDYEMVETSENDAEPNNTFDQALPINEEEVKKGHIGYLANGSDDAYDYYKTKLPLDGTLEIYVQGTNRRGSTGYLYLYGYDKRKASGQVVGTYISGSSVKNDSTIYDTIRIYGLLSDTFYFRIQSNGAFQYQLSYKMTLNSAPDEEPNNTFADAIFMRQGITKNGQVNYEAGGITDTYDYYKTLLPEDGTMKIYVKGTNDAASAGYLYMYGFDNRQASGQLFGEYINSSSTPAGATVYDTITVYGRAADTVYFRLQATRAFTYSFSYDIVDVSDNDVEPNNIFDDAVNINLQETKYGHIGYTARGADDPFDYYKAELPVDGTLKVYVKGTNQKGSSGYLYMYVYDRRKASGQLLGQYIKSSSTAAGATIYDTLIIKGRAADIAYFRLNSTGAFSYSLSYDVVDTSENDLEPNNTYETALPINRQQEKVGHIGYVKNGGDDQFDYYRAVLPFDGTLKVYVNGTNTGSVSAYMYMYGYDRRKASGQIFAQYIKSSSTPSGAIIYDTITVHGRAADTVYFRLQSTGAFKYSLSYDVVDTSENDMEPNNTFAEALPIQPKETKVGHIGYVQNGTDDASDYYKTLLPFDGTLKVYVKGTNKRGSVGYLYMYGYDARKASGQVFAQYIKSSSTPAGATIYDTIVVNCRSVDSFYYRVISSGAFDYEFSYEIVDSSAQDTEPNDEFETATRIKYDSTYFAHIGYVTSGVTDRNDYFAKVMDRKGSVRVIVEATNTSGGNGNLFLYAYKNNTGPDIGLAGRPGNVPRGALGGEPRDTVLTGYVQDLTQVAAGRTIRDTFNINCFAADTLWLRWVQSGCFSYSFRTEFVDNQPKADLTYERFGNTVGFRPQLSNGNGFIWNFGDGTTSNLQYPVKTFTTGVYTARLIAFNNVCDFRDTATTIISVTGIERFTPTKGGIGGDLNMQIFGGGLDTATRVTLKKGNISIPAFEKYSNNEGSMLGLVFDLHFAQTGKYTLEVVFGSGEVITFDSAFTIEAMIYPDTYSEIVGPDRWRTGRTGNFNLVVGNNGNTVARGVIAVLVWPKAANLQFYGKQYSPNADEFITVDLEEYNETIKSSYGLAKWVYDSINTVTPIDTFKTEAYDGYAQFLYVPVIAPKSTYELPFTITADQSAEFKLITYTVKPNQYGSCETFNINTALTGPAAVELMINSLDWAVDELKVPKATKIPAQIAVKTLKVTQKHIDVSSNVLAHRMWAAYYNWTSGGGGENHGLTDDEYYDYYKEGLAADEFAKTQLQDIAIDQGINLLKIPAGGKKNKLTDQIHDNNQALLNKANDYQQIAGKKTGRTKTWRMKKKEAAKEWKDQFESGQKTIEELTQLENLEAIADGAGIAKNAKGELEALLKYIEENCPEHKEAVEKLKEELNKEKDIRKEKEKKTETSTSFDPNAIYGPAGFNAPRYVNNIDRQPFVIMFENVDTAKADAQIVKITETLDKNKFDLSTFELGNITIGGKWYQLPKSRNEVVMDIDLSPERDMRVRLNASIDTATGIATWQFTSIDKVTNDLPDFDGFLPPNVNYPAGEGSVTFSVYPLKNLPHGSVLNSKASIIFDFNEPILTNTWMNTIDALKPSGNIQSQVFQDSVIVINYGATDADAGVEYYNLYISEDNNEWVSIGGGNYTSQRFIGQPGKTYYFYVEAEDRVGNREEKSPVAETTVSISPVFAITLGDITATSEPARNRIDWNTLHEDAGDWFEVEKSIDGRNFTTLTKRSGSNRAADYIVYDNAPADGRNYYRLKMYDISGGFKYSRVVSVIVLNQRAFVMEAYPNPVSNQLNIILHGAIDGRGVINMFDMMGKQVLQIPVNRNRISLDISSQPRGNYIVKYTDSKNAEVIKITKQ